MARLTNEQVADLRRQFDRYMGGSINTVTGKREWDTFHGLPIPALLADLEEARAALRKIRHYVREPWCGSPSYQIRELIDEAFDFAVTEEKP